MIYRIVVAAILIVVGLILGPTFKTAIIKLSEKSAPAQGALTFIGSCVSIVTILISFVIALTYLGVNMNVIIGTMSAVGLGISLSVKDNMSNVAGGIQILLTRPFKVGDYIRVEGYEGFVQRVEMMFTVIQSWDGSEIVLPNAKAVNDTLVNMTHNQVRAVHITFDVSSLEDFDRIKAFCLQTAVACEYILEDPKTNVYIEKLSTSKYSIGMYAWCKVEEYWLALYDLNERIQKQRLEKGVLGPIQSISIR